jgi:hypothetical protein
MSDERVFVTICVPTTPQIRQVMDPSDRPLQLSKSSKDGRPEDREDFLQISVDHRFLSTTGLERGNPGQKHALFCSSAWKQEKKYIAGRVVKEFNPGLMIP